MDFDVQEIYELTRELAGAVLEQEKGWYGKGAEGNAESIRGEPEVQQHNRDHGRNYRNGYSKKTVKTQLGAVEVKVPRERNGEYEPQIIGKYNRNADGMEEKILSTFFAYPTEIRKIIYTTNIIEGLNRQFRQITKNKPSFTNDDSLRKMLYLASRKIVEHWTSRCRNWDMVLAQLQLMFRDRQTA